MIQEKYTFCPICTNHCAFKAIIKDGKVVDILGAGETGFPVNICSLQKGAAHVIGVLNAPDRLKHPLRRKGDRGEGKWEQISWDEALDTIAGKLLDIKDKYGPERVAVLLNEPKGMEYAFGQRFATAFGTPNVATPGCYCGVQTGSALRFTFGSQNIQARTEADPRVVIIWGANLAHTGGTFTGIKRNAFNKAVAAGCKVVVIDPKNIEIWPEKGMLASDADYWIRPRPNSDGLLAMGMIKVIIEEKLYDENYIKEWCTGFNELRDEMETFTLDDIERLTWVPRQQIREVARVYATNRPGIIGWGNALEGSSQAFQTCRAIAILRGICGNVNTPDGGEHEVESAPITPPGRFMFGGPLRERLKECPRSPERTIGGKFKLALRSMYVPTESFVKALLDEEPYLPKAALAILTNPVLSYPDTKKTYQAFMKLDFFVVSELFHTPTTAIADIVLPAATIHEHDTLGYWPAWYGCARAHPKLVDPPGEAWPDIKIVNELAKRVGLAKYFWDDEKEALDYMLEPAGISWEKFRDEIRYLEAKSKYNPHRVVGYQTPSGKVEISSSLLKDMGYSSIPKFKELVEPLSGKFELTEEYPLIMTDYKSEVFMLSGFRNIKELRRKSPPPTVFMNAETAKELGFEDGDWVCIETRQGKVEQRLMTDPKVHPKVVNTAFGWGGTEEFEACNMNVLTDCNPPYDAQTGSVTIRGYPCRVSKVGRGEVAWKRY